MSDFHTYEYEVRHRARRLREEAQAERRAYEVRAYLREQRRTAVATVARRILHAFGQLIGRRKTSHTHSSA
jgi:hypothetical protein